MDDHASFRHLGQLVVEHFSLYFLLIQIRLKLVNVVWNFWQCTQNFVGILSHKCDDMVWLCVECCESVISLSSVVGRHYEMSVKSHITHERN